MVARPAPAKEHTAACPELVRMIGVVRASLEAASTQRRRGSSLGAYQVLRATAASMVRDSGGGRCGALGPTLSAALRRATTARTALDASVELDLGLDAAMSLATEGHLPYSTAPPKCRVGVRRRPSPRQWRSSAKRSSTPKDCPDLFALTRSLEGPPQRLPERVKALLADLDAHPRCAQVRRVLAQAPADRLAHAVQPDSASTSRTRSKPPNRSTS